MAVSMRHRVEEDIDADCIPVRGELEKNSGSSPSRSHESAMSVLCVITDHDAPVVVTHRAEMRHRSFPRRVLTSPGRRVRARTRCW